MGLVKIIDDIVNLVLHNIALNKIILTRAFFRRDYDAIEYLVRFSNVLFDLLSNLFITFIKDLFKSYIYPCNVYLSLFI